MRFIDNNRVVSAQVSIGLRFGQKNPIGHQFQIRIFGGAIFEPDFITDSPTQILPEFFGNPAGIRHGRNAARLGMSDNAVDAPSRCQAELGQLRGFAGAGFTGYNDHRLPAYGLNDFVFFGGYRELFVVTELRQVLFTPGAFALGCFEAFFKPRESGADSAGRQRFAPFAGQALDFLQGRQAVGSRHTG